MKMMMMLLSKSSVVLALLALLRYLQLLLSNTALALGVNKFRNYWSKKKNELPLYVLCVPIVFTLVNLMLQQFMAIFTGCYCYDSRISWVAFAASFCHLLGAVFLYIVFGSRLQRVSIGMALMLLGLAGIRIIFEHDTRVPAFLACQLWIIASKLSEL